MTTYLALRRTDTNEFFAPLTKKGKVRFTKSITKACTWPADTKVNEVIYAKNAFNLIRGISVEIVQIEETDTGWYLTKFAGKATATAPIPT